MEWKQGLWVDTIHFICGPDAKLNGRASASNGRVMIGCCRFSMPTPPNIGLLLRRLVADQIRRGVPMACEMCLEVVAARKLS
jgi:hypothetical protein